MNKSLWCVPLFALLLQGCGTGMTRYDPDFDNVQVLKKELPLQALTAPTVTASAETSKLSVRNNPIKSPVGSIPQHIQTAIADELRLAGLFNANAERRLDVALLRNDLNSGMFNGTGELWARFTVHKGDTVVYDGVQKATTHWDSSYFGFIAIPAAARAYNPLVRELLHNLYSDPLFIKALK